MSCSDLWPGNATKELVCTMCRPTTRGGKTVSNGDIHHWKAFVVFHSLKTRKHEKKELCDQ